MNIILLSIVWYIFNHLGEKIFQKKPGCSLMLYSTMTIARKFTALHLSIQVDLTLFRSVFEFTRNPFNWSVFRSDSLLCSLRYDSSPCPCSSSLFSSCGFLLLLSLRLFLLKGFQAYVGRETKSNTKNLQSKKMRKSQFNIKKEGKTLQRQWNATQKREREAHFHRKTFLTGRFLLQLSSMQLSDRCAIRCSFQQGHWPLPMSFSHHTCAFRIFVSEWICLVDGDVIKKGRWPSELTFIHLS